MDVIENFDGYIIELEDHLFELYNFLEEDQFVQACNMFSKIRALLTMWEHDYLTKLKGAFKGL